MAEGPIHSEREGGIFIPYDRLLQQQNDKLDKILEELRAMDKNKLDVNLFTAFRNTYEERHEILRKQVDSVERELLDRPEQVQEFHKAQEDIKTLFKDKAERDAIKAQTRYYLAGGGLVGLLVIVNLTINAWQIVVGHP